MISQLDQMCWDVQAIANCCWGSKPMPVYVDAAVNPWKGKKWCHLTADSGEELHTFAASIGLRREWFQNHRFLPHYDLTESKRRLAINKGAIVLSQDEMGKRVRAARLAQRIEKESKCAPPSYHSS